MPPSLYLKRFKMGIDVDEEKSYLLRIDIELSTVLGSELRANVAWSLENHRRYTAHIHLVAVLMLILFPLQLCLSWNAIYVLIKLSSRNNIFMRIFYQSMSRIFFRRIITFFRIISEENFG